MKGEDSQSTGNSHDPVSAAIQGFVAFLTLERRRSPRTIHEYTKDVECFSSFVQHGGASGAALLQATPSHIRQFLIDMTNRQLSAATVRRRIAALRAFYKFVKREGLRDDNPAADAGNISLPKRLPKALSIGDTLKLLKTAAPAGTSEAQRRRNAAILELLYATGIRRAELVGLDLGDVNFDRRTMRVVGKGNKERYVLFTKAAAEALRRYLEVRLPAADDALFVSRLGKRLSYPQVGNVFRVFVVLSGLKGKISPHTMRHSFATHLHERGVDIMTIKELLGHESVATTQLYAKVTLEHMRQVYEEAHPRDAQGER